MTYKDLPVYDLQLLSEDDGVFCISIVDNPAVQREFLKFEDDKQITYSFTNDDKQVLSGIAMIPDMPIYRRDSSGREYYVMFSKETIRKIVERFAKNKFADIISLQHEMPVDDCYVIESYVIDKARGICPVEFADITDGSWYISIKVDNPEIWDLVKNKDILHGFSVEVLSTPVRMSSDENKNQNQNSSMNKFKQFLMSLVTNFGEVATDKGKLFWDGEEDLKAGDKVYVEDAEAEDGFKAAEDGEYVTEDNKTIVVVEGAVAEIKDPEAEVQPEAEVEAEPETEEMAEEEEQPQPEAEAEQDNAPEYVLKAEFDAAVQRIAELEKVVEDMRAEMAKALQAPQAESAFAEIKDVEAKQSTIGKKLSVLGKK